MMIQPRGPAVFTLADLDAIPITEEMVDEMMESYAHLSSHGAFLVQKLTSDSKFRNEAMATMKRLVGFMGSALALQPSYDMQLNQVADAVINETVKDPDVISASLLLVDGMIFDQDSLLVKALASPEYHLRMERLYSALNSHLVTCLGS